jgi:hypothetical protein
MVWVFALTIALGLLISTFSFTGAGMLGILILVLAIGENRRLRYTVLGLLWIFIVLFTATPTGRQRIRTVTQWTIWMRSNVPARNVFDGLAAFKLAIPDSHLATQPLGWIRPG